MILTAGAALRLCGQIDEMPARVVHSPVCRVECRSLSRVLQTFGQKVSQTIVTQVVTRPSVSDSTVILFASLHVTLTMYRNAL